MTRSAAVLLVLGIALGVRLGFVAQIADSPLLGLPELHASDMHWYDRWAREISAGDWLGRDLSVLYTSWQDRVATREEWTRWFPPHVYNAPPLYPYFAAGVYALSGPRPAALLVAQAFLGAGSCLLLLGIGRRAFGDGAGLAAGLAGALYGPLVFYDGMVLRTTLIAAVQLLVVYALLRAAEPGGTLRRAARFAAAGVASGLAVLAQPTALGLAAGALVWIAWREGGAREGPSGRAARGRRVAVALSAHLLGLSLPLGALVARNLEVGAPAFAIASRGPFALVVGNVADAPLGGVGFTIPDSAISVLRESDFRLLPSIAGVLRTHESPAGFLAFEGRKLLAVASDFEIPNNVSYAYVADRIPLLGFLPRFAHAAGLGLAGVFLALRARGAGEGARGARALVGLYALFGLGASVVSLVLSRYRVPLATALLLYAGLAAAWIVAAARAGRLVRAGAAAAAALAVGLLVARDLGVELPRLRAAEPLGVAEVLARRGRPTAAAAEIEGVLARFEGRPRVQARLLRAAASYRASAGQRALARRHRRRAAALDPAGSTRRRPGPGAEDAGDAAGAGSTPSGDASPAEEAPPPARPDAGHSATKGAP